MTGASSVVDALLLEVRAAAFPDGEYVGQESFVGAGEVLSLARRAGIGPGVCVLDVCCGTAGPGRLVARATGCAYLGLDARPEAVAAARRQARVEGLDARFAVRHVPPLPPGPFDVVLLLETMLAFRDKSALVGAVSRALRVGGRFAFTLEEGQPLTAAERCAMPASDTVWPVPLTALVADLEAAGLWVRRLEDRTAAHRATVDALVAAYTASAARLEAVMGAAAVADLLASHRLWSRWLSERRVCKFAVIADKVPDWAPHSDPSGGWECDDQVPLT